MLKNEYFVANIGFDTVENSPLKVCQKLSKSWKKVINIGQLNVSEFTNGLRRMKSGARAKDILEVLKKLRSSLIQAEDMQKDVDFLGDAMEDLEDELITLTKDLDLIGDVCDVLNQAFSVPAKKKKRKPTAPELSRKKAQEDAKSKPPGGAGGQPADGPDVKVAESGESGESWRAAVTRSCVR